MIDHCRKPNRYRYDALGRRIEKVSAAGTRRYVYDREDLFLEYDATDTLRARYTHGPGIDEPLAMERDIDGDGAFETLSYHGDALGSVTELTDAAGAVVQAYVYDAFGETTITDGTGTTIEAVAAIAHPYAYTARELDAETGEYFYRARYYAQGLGRFGTEDPIGFAGGSANLYGYVLNNPVKFSDPSGLLRVLFGGRGSFFFGGAGATFGGALGFDSSGKVCIQVQSCGRLGAGTSIGLRGSFTIGGGEFCEGGGNDLSGGFFGTIGLGIIGSVSTNTSAFSGNTSVTGTAGVGGGVSGGFQGCVSRVVCL